MKIKDFLSRVNGISTSFIGISWDPRKQDYDVVNKFLIELGDRRFLANDHGIVDRKNLFESILYTRHLITESMKSVEADSILFSKFSGLRNMLSEFQTFLEYGISIADNENIYKNEELFIAFREIRIKFSQAVQFLADIHNLKLPDNLKGNLLN